MGRGWRTAAVTLIVAAAVGIGGCAVADVPTPSAAPPFASEEEAFAAAEETYRAYVDALNQSRLDGRPAPTDLLAGEALESSLKGTQMLEEARLHIVGDSVIVQFEHVRSSDGEVQVGVCVDSGRTRVVDEDGNDRTPHDRADLAGLEITMIYIDSRLLIVTSTTEERYC